MVALNLFVKKLQYCPNNSQFSQKAIIKEMKKWLERTWLSLTNNNILAQMVSPNLKMNNNLFQLR